MRRIFSLILICALLAVPVSAMEFNAPPAPSTAEEYLPESSENFWQDLWYIVKIALSKLAPNITETGRVCISILAIAMLVSLLQDVSTLSARTLNLVGTAAISIALLSPANTLIQLGVQTIESISEYAKLLIPVMTAALAAEGGAATSTALYTGTVIFNTILSGGITRLLVPMLYAYIALGIANVAIDESTLKNLKDFIKWLITWSLKIAIYTFTGYLGISGVISGTTDAAAVKATKLAISGSVPVVGGIISDATETILLSAGIMKNAAGIYGLLVILAIWIEPFLQIGIQYVLLKATAGVCGVFGCKRVISLVEHFCSVMGFLVAITATVCLLLLISIVCFMKGVG